MKRFITTSILFLVILVSLGQIGFQIWTQDWQPFDRCQPALLPWLPDKVPGSVKGIERRLLSIRQYSRDFPFWWESVANLPNSDSYIDAVWEIEVIDQNIWMLRSGLIQRHDLDKDITIDYLNTASGLEITWAHHVMVLPNGEVWAIVRLENSHELAKYDEKMDSFQIILMQDNPFLTFESLGEYDFESNYAVTLNGEFLIPINNNIYQITPEMETYELLLPESFIYEISSIAVSNDSIWFTDTKLGDLWQLDIFSGNLVNHGGVFNRDNFKAPVGIDGLGRIWVGFGSRLEPGENNQYHWWEMDNYPEEFLDLTNPHLDCLSGCDDRILGVTGAYNIHTSSNGNIWFSTPAGVVEYDVYDDNWCLSLYKMPYDITEDRNGNLWLALDSSTHYRGIYKYELEITEK